MALHFKYTKGDGSTHDNTYDNGFSKEDSYNLILRTYTHLILAAATDSDIWM